MNPCGSWSKSSTLMFKASQQQESSVFRTLSKLFSTYNSSKGVGGAAAKEWQKQQQEQRQKKGRHQQNTTPLLLLLHHFVDVLVYLRRPCSCCFCCCCCYRLLLPFLMECWPISSWRCELLLANLLLLPHPNCIIHPHGCTNQGPKRLPPCGVVDLKTHVIQVAGGSDWIWGSGQGWHLFEVCARSRGSVVDWTLNEHVPNHTIKESKHAHLKVDGFILWAAGVDQSKFIE